MSGHKQVDVRGKIILYSVVVYAIASVIAFALIPVTEGRSLTAFCPILILIAIEGLLYVILS